MLHLKYSLFLSILAGLLVSHPALATTNMQLTIVNNSGYPDSQVYLVWIGKPGNDAAKSYHITNWQNIAIAVNSTDHNTVHFANEPDNGYADYSTTLDKLKINGDGRRYFELPPCPEGSTPKGIASSRLWLSFGKPLYFHIESNVKNTQPSVNTLNDVNYDTVWDFFEFNSSYDSGLDKFAAHANTTNIDAVGMPMVYELYDGATQKGIKGLNLTKKEIYKAFASVPVMQPLTNSMRIVSPAKSLGDPAGPLYFPTDYFDTYRDYCWSYWDGSSDAKTIKFTYSGYSWDNGKVDQATGKLTITCKVGETDEAHEITTKPPSKDIFGCDGVFKWGGTVPPPDPWAVRDAAMKNMISSALNRSVMHKAIYIDPNTPTQYPWGEPTYVDEYYYTNKDNLASFKTNIYSKVLHQLAIGKKIYGFPYDDNNAQSSYIEGPGTEIRLTINNCRLSNATPGPNLLLLY
jgi:hypothetical protein